MKEKKGVGGRVERKEEGGNEGRGDWEGRAEVEVRRGKG